VLELAEPAVTVVLCMARADVLDRLAETATAEPCRCAEDELLLFSFGDGVDLFAACDPGADGLAIDVTGGYAVFSLQGDRAADALARLSSIPPPATLPAFVQGAVAHVPGKALVRVGRLDVIVSSVHADYVRRRIRSACADLGVRG
jgi:sarcosine oxidase gamma subunit